MSDNYKYKVMNAEQKQMANAAAAAINKAVDGMHPMAVFEALCTLTSQYLYMLDLDLSSSTLRIEDRLRVMQKFGPQLGLTTLKSETQSSGNMFDAAIVPAKMEPTRKR